MFSRLKRCTEFDEIWYGDWLNVEEVYILLNKISKTNHKGTGK